MINFYLKFMCSLTDIQPWVIAVAVILPLLAVVVFVIIGVVFYQSMYPLEPFSFDFYNPFLIELSLIPMDNELTIYLYMPIREKESSSWWWWWYKESRI